MNTIVRSVPRVGQAIQLTESPFGRVSDIIQNRFVLMVSVLIAAIFISSLAVIYNQEDNRMLFNELSSLHHDKDVMYMTWGQLLLEESTLSTQSRVQTIAVTKLNMQMPNQKNIVIVQH